MKKETSWLFYCLVLIVVWSYISYIIGYKKAETKTFNNTMDSIQSIIEKQIGQDSSVTQLMIINPDTTIYILSPKTIK